MEGKAAAALLELGPGRAGGVDEAEAAAEAVLAARM